MCSALQLTRSENRRCDDKQSAKLGNYKKIPKSPGNRSQVNNLFVYHLFLVFVYLFFFFNLIYKSHNPTD